MATQLDNVRCHDCKLTPREIVASDPIRIPSVKYDVHAKRMLCNHCWASITPTWGAIGR